MTPLDAPRLSRALETEAQTLRKKLAACGATLFAVGMFTGIFTAAALTDTIKIGMPRLALTAHLNALLGGLWLVLVAWTFEFLNYTTRGLRRLAVLVALPAWANWLITLAASLVGVNGLTYTSDFKNNIVAFLLQAFVVLPTLVASVAWAWGFRRANRK